jgi:hypothetical protein
MNQTHTLNYQAILPTLLILCVMLMIPACDYYDHPVCGVDGTVVEENGLILTLKQKSDEPPAHVYLLLKVDRKGLAGRHTPLTNLAASNFTIYENERRISVESDYAVLPQPGNFISHTLLLLDLSGSILDDSASLRQLKAASTTFINALMSSSSSGSDEMRMGIYWFDGDKELDQLVPFTTDSNELIDGIKRIRAGMSRDRSTNLNGAVINGAKMVKDLSGIEADTVNIGALAIFTDGTDQAARKSTEKALDAVDDARERGVSVYTVGLGQEIDEGTLKSFGRDGFFFASDINELLPRFADIATQIRNDMNSHYLVEYCSPKRNGEHSLKIVVSSQSRSGSLTTCFDADDFKGGCVLHNRSGVTVSRRRSKG